MVKVWHPWHKWECYRAGLYETKPPAGMSADEAKEAYAVFLSNSSLFGDNLYGVTSEWIYSCQHFLTNININRIAWLGQASMCYYSGVPAIYRAGFKLLSEQEQLRANQLAAHYLKMYFSQTQLGINYEKKY